MKLFTKIINLFGLYTEQQLELFGIKCWLNGFEDGKTGKCFRLKGKSKVLHFMHTPHGDN